MRLRTTLAARVGHLAARDRLWLGGLLGFAVLVEVLGRNTAGEFEDGLLLFAVLGCSGAIAFVHARAPLAWVCAAIERGRRLQARARGLLLEVGVDLRGAPEVAAGTPMLLAAAVHALGVATLVLIATAVLGVGEVRPIAARVLYVGYLAALGALWAALVCGSLVMALLPVAWIHDAFVARHAGGPRRKRDELLAIGGCFALVLLGGLLLPLWIPLLLCAAGLLAFCAVVWGSGPDLSLLWRRRGRGGVRAVRWRAYLTLSVLLLTLAWLDLVLLATGRAALGLPAVAGSTPVTGALGAILAWLGGVGLASGLVCSLRWIVLQRRLDPARPSPTVVHVAGSLEQRAEIESVLRARGFRVRFAPRPVEPDDVRLIVQPGPMRPLGGRPRWPLQVSAKALHAPELLDLIARRDEVQRRRQLVRGFELLFKRLTLRTFNRGTGLWIAPHYWFMYGASRDTEEDEVDLDQGPVLSDRVGPPYHQLFPRSARHHFGVVLCSLEVDLIFVEDGVGFRRFRAVLRVLFEHHDVYGGRQRIEERHLTGLVGTRVMIHEYELGTPLAREGYPEPDYEDIGRARVLHVFVDRGEHEAPDDEPTTSEDLPAPRQPALAP